MNKLQILNISISLVKATPISVENKNYSMYTAKIDRNIQDFNMYCSRHKKKLDCYKDYHLLNVSSETVEKDSLSST